MRATLVGGTLLALAVLALPADAAEAPAGRDRAGVTAGPRVARPAGTPGAALSQDERFGVPNLVRFARGRHRFAFDRGSEAAARAALDAVAPTWGLSAEALAAAEVRSTHERRSGVRLVVLGQRVGGLEVFEQELALLFAADGDLVAAGGTLLPRFESGGARFALGARDAIAAAERAVGLGGPGRRWRAGAREDRYGRHFELVTSIAGGDGESVAGRGRAGRVWFPIAHTLVPAWRIELLLDEAGTTDGSGWLVVVAADDGRELLRRDLVQSDAFQYRVWAGAGPPHTPADSPLADITPHPTGTPDTTLPAPVAPVLISIEGFNTNPSLGVDPWLADGATQTQGNNVDAYTDENAPDGFSGGDQRATTTAAGVFDRTFDTGLGPLASTNQKLAAVTQLFFTTNWLHDYWYDSGFDEAAGNAQQDNFGRGGIGNDRLQAQALDSSATERDNANMSTPADGLSPRMQMYVWSESVDASLSATPGGAYGVGWASFGPTAFDTTAQMAVAVDGASPTGDACTALTNGATISGKIALVDRGNCDFTVKVTNAENAGAVGVVIADNVLAASPPQMGGAGPGISVGTLSVTQADGAELKTAISSGAVTATIHRSEGTERSGELDGMIVTHEWGHYLHHRLVSCGSEQCAAQSEGWGDFVALHTSIGDADDTATGTYAAGFYGPLGLRFAAPYFGIRRYPYSRDPEKSPLSFRHIADSEALPTDPPPAMDFTIPENSEVHNAGEVWAAMLLDAYGALIDLHDGETARRRMADYVVLGMQLAPASPTFTEQRDALLAAAAASDVDDATAMGQAFALRGAGPCAVSPARASTTFAGVEEDFTTNQGTLEIAGVELDDDVSSCDSDGALDAGEVGTLRVTVRNVTAGDLPGFTLQAASDSADILLANGGTASGPAVPAFSTAEVALQATADADLASLALLHFDLDLDGASLCAPATGELDVLVDYDPVPSATESFSIPGGWTVTGSPAGLWTRVLDGANPSNFVYEGPDSDGITDIQLVSPAIQVSGSAFSVAFSHAYQFERSQGKNWDGGVVEFSTNNGATWADVTVAGAVPGYDGTIDSSAGNPLGGRQGYAGQSSGYPTRQTATLNFGTGLAGQTVRIRFRIGTDEAFGGDGWQVDDVMVTGASASPFLGATAEAATCEASEIFSDGFESGTTAAWTFVQAN